MLRIGIVAADFAVEIYYVEGSGLIVAACVHRSDNVCSARNRSCCVRGCACCLCLFGNNVVSKLLTCFEVDVADNHL